MTYDTNNVFAKIIRSEIASNRIYEDENILAFHDINKAAPIHIIVIPKGNYESFADFSSKATDYEISNFFKMIKIIAKDQGLENSGYRIISNVGKDASQSVPHFHFHILGGKSLGGLIQGDDFQNR